MPLYAKHGLGLTTVESAHCGNVNGLFAGFPDQDRYIQVSEAINVVKKIFFFSLFPHSSSSFTKKANSPNLSLQKANGRETRHHKDTTRARLGPEEPSCVEYNHEDGASPRWLAGFEDPPIDDAGDHG